MLAPTAPRDLLHALAVLALLTLRVAPTAWCLTTSVPGIALRFALGVASSLCLWPIALRLAPASLSLDSLLWAALPLELARGTVLGFGVVLPILALGWAGRISDALREARGSDESPLARLYSAAAIALVFASGAHAVVFRALAGSLSDVPLGTVAARLANAQPVFLELSKLLARAFELAIVFAGPVLLVGFTGLVIAGVGARVSAPLAAALTRGPVLPFLGLSGACLGISSILSALPQALSVFVAKTLALVAGLR